MNKKIIVIEGYLAAGKSSFALKLSGAIQVPYIIKDNFKTALCTSVTIQDRAQSSGFSAITFDGMMYMAERFLETGYPLIIEGNFVPAGVKKVDEAGTIKELIRRYEYQSLDFKFTGDTEILHKRFLEREESPERGAANKMMMDFPYAMFAQSCHRLSGFDIGGEVVKVDTTVFDSVDFVALEKRARDFLNGTT